MRIYHNSRLKEYRNPGGAAEIGSTVRLAVNLESEYPGENISDAYVILRLWRDDKGESRVVMTGEDGMYSAEITMPDTGCLIWYFFIIKTGNSGEEGGKILYYGNNKMNTGGEGMIYEFQPPSFQITVYKRSPVPQWFKDSIVYQIFPDRFARDEGWEKRCIAAIKENADRCGEKKILEKDWYKPAYYIKDSKGNVTGWPFYGGSLKGIEQNLDYIKSLGATVIYLNPIFSAVSNHRYDTADYMSIDPILGSEEDFVSLAKAAEHRGIRIFLDGVFSHTGADSIYFDKYGNYGGGAYSDIDSPYRGWYEISDKNPDEYKCWWGTGDLPEVNENNESYRSFICGAEGVLAKWLRLGASGWRLDVADELPDDFIRDVRKRVKEEDSENLLMGEVWEDASNKESYGVKRRYLMGDELDSTMNYPLRTIITDFLGGIADVRVTEEKILSLKENYPPENYYGAMNLIGSHDKERILTVMGADEDYDDAARRVKMAALMEFAMPGVPCIYYGDEAGMTGGKDPENRSGFIWKKENPDLELYYRQLGVIYDEHPVLKDGDIRMISGELEYTNGEESGDVLAFIREYPGSLPAGTGGYDAPDHNSNDGYANFAVKEVKDETEFNAQNHGTDYAKSSENGETVGSASKQYRPDNCGLNNLNDLSALNYYPGDEKMLVLVNRSTEVRTVSLRETNEVFGEYALELLSSSEIRIRDGNIEDIIVLEPLSAKLICIRQKVPCGFEMKRSAGVICHISSIPGGKLGKEADNFADYLASAGMRLWQILPLCPPGQGGSPYSSNSAFAGNPEFIKREGLPDMRFYKSFCDDNSWWLDDYAEYTVLKRMFDNRPWYEWPGKYRDRLVHDCDEGKLEEVKKDQYYFFAQWQHLKQYANSKGIEIIGDIPAFVSLDSADVWGNKNIFLINDDGTKKCHAGVPPDYFTEDGQNWGNPLYDWEELRNTGYEWWIRRLGQCAERYDYVRLDHFRSFSEYYSIPEGKKASEGRWQHGPGIKFFEAVNEALNGKVRILAEDLGDLDVGVSNLLKLSGLPGMNVWQFSHDEMEHMSEEHAARRVFYTGTHDNQTILGWAKSAGGDPAEALDIIRKLYTSAAPWTMIQMQDLFLLDDSCRMNTPGIPSGNWQWQIPGNSVAEAFAEGSPYVYSNADKIAKAFMVLARENGRIEGYDAPTFLRKHGIKSERTVMNRLTSEMYEFYKKMIAEHKISYSEYNGEDKNGTVIAIDMGGTNIRVARISMNTGTASPVTVERQVKNRMPGIEGESTSEELFDKVASMVRLVDRNGDCDKIGFSFSFPTAVHPSAEVSDVDSTESDQAPAGVLLAGNTDAEHAYELLDDEPYNATHDKNSLHYNDAMVTEWGKELHINGGTGSYVGEMLNEALERSGQSRRQITVLNDTSAAFMAHKALGRLPGECVAGFVLGTGANICFLDKKRGRIYNLESGKYAGFPAGDFDDILDKESVNPGRKLGEKKMSGAYLSQLVSIAAEKAIEEGFVSRSLDTANDKNVLACIDSMFIERSAVYSAVTVATALKLACGDARGDYSVLVEGSVFWKTKDFKNKVEKDVNDILKYDGITCTFIRFPDSSLVGAAEAV